MPVAKVVKRVGTLSLCPKKLKKRPKGLKKCVYPLSLQKVHFLLNKTPPPFEDTAYGPVSGCLPVERQCSEIDKHCSELSLLLVEYDVPIC